MAAPQCQSGDGNPAALIGTFLEGGQPVALCNDCLVPWAAALIEGMTGYEMAPVLAAALADDGEEPGEGSGEPAGEEQESPGEPDPPSPNGKHGRSSRKSAGAGTGDDPGGDPPAPGDQSEPAAA